MALLGASFHLLIEDQGLVLSPILVASDSNQLCCVLGLGHCFTRLALRLSLLLQFWFWGLPVVASPVSEHRLWGTWSPTVLAHKLSSVAHGLSCSSARGIPLGQGWNLHLLHWQADSLPLTYQGSPGHKVLELCLPSRSQLILNLGAGLDILLYVKSYHHHHIASPNIHNDGT